MAKAEGQGTLQGPEPSPDELEQGQNFPGNCWVSIVENTEWCGLLAGCQASHNRQWASIGPTQVAALLGLAVVGAGGN